MHPSEVSAYVNMQHLPEVSGQKRAEANVANHAAATVVSRLDTTSVSAGARALTWHKQAEIASAALSPDRLRELRAQRPNPERIAEAMLQADRDA